MISYYFAKNVAAMFVILTSSAAQALPAAYSFAQLDTYWTTQVGDPAPNDLEAYNEIVGKPVASPGEPVVSDKPPREMLKLGAFGHPQELVVSRGSDGGLPAFSVMPILPLSRASGRVFRRAALVESYLHKFKIFTGEGSRANATLLQERHVAARIEIFLADILRFAQARTLPAKCAQATRALDGLAMLENQRNEFGDLPVGSGAASLKSLFATISAKYDPDQLKALKDFTCSARTVLTKASLLKEIENTVAQQLVDGTPSANGSPGASSDRLAGYDERLANTVEIVTRGYQQVTRNVQDTVVPVSGLIAVRDKLANIKSNFDIVHSDMFCLDRSSSTCGGNSFMQRLLAIKFEDMKAFGNDVSDPVIMANTKYDDSIGDTAGLLSMFINLAKAAESAPPNEKIHWAPCKELVVKFQALEDLTLQPESRADAIADTKKKFRSQLVDCLGGALTVFNSLKAANASQGVVDDAFASSVSELSDAVLTFKGRGAGQ